MNSMSDSSHEIRKITEIDQSNTQNLQTREADIQKLEELQGINR